MATRILMSALRPSKHTSKLIKLSLLMSKITVITNSEESRNDHLPPVISANIRQKVLTAQIPIDAITLKQEKIFDHQTQLVYYHTEPPPKPMPKHPLILSWEPDHLHFDLFEEPVEAKLRVWNRTARPIQIQCCGLWGDNSRLGASWRTYPRTRFWLPSGPEVNMFVYANPRPTSPIPSACSSLQIAATHLRDLVTGYFMVPVYTRFFKYEDVLPENE